MIEAIRGGQVWNHSFSGWLYRIAHNLVIDYYRARDRHRDISIDDIAHIPDLSANPPRAAELALDGNVLRAAMGQLTDEQATVINLRFFEGCSSAEIANQMGRTEGAIKALQHRAVDRLRQLLPYAAIED